MPRFHNINGERVQFTAEEETARDAEEQAWAAGANDRAAAQVREERDALLAACDWMANSDVTMSIAWRTYRQALRDVPEQLPGEVTWPTPPE
tara:strand:+ start:3575 stop:3850 length:276 start_codon:yes stop_codon:yes gene_type:complete